MQQEKNSSGTRPSKAELVSIGLPVRNGADTIEGVVDSVLAQDYGNIELIISDNASTDDTERLCRSLASRDARITYHRQPQNVGLLNNLIHTMTLARGTFFRWVGDDDWLAPNCVSRCMEVFARDPRLILVTTQLNYVKTDGSVQVSTYDGTTFYSDDPIERFAAYVRYLANGFVPIDPLYGLMRRASIAAIVRRNTIREDEVFATKMALAGPWGHVPETLGRRNLRSHRLPQLARYLNVPVWQAHFATSVQSWEMLRFLHGEPITGPQRRRAQGAVARLFVRRHYRTLMHRTGRLVGLITRRRLPTLAVC